MNELISLVIPVYNSAECIRELHRRIDAALNKIQREFELIFVEDCSNDHSWEIIKELAKLDQRVVGIKMSRNFGQHNALLCGIRAAKGTLIITLDDDLQHPPEEIQKLLLGLEEGFDVVYGAPEMQQHSSIRNLASYATKVVLEGAMGTKNATKVTAFRAFHTHLRNAFARYRGPTVNIDVLLTWATSNFTAVRVRHEPRKTGKSGYNTRKLVKHALNMITGYSTKPLQLASMMGFALASLGAMILAYVLMGWLLLGGTVPGFTFLASVISIFSGAQLLALGIIGEYLARIHLRNMEQPIYLVHETTVSGE